MRQKENTERKGLVKKPTPTILGNAAMSVSNPMRLVPVSTRLMARKFREEAGTRAKRNSIQHRQQQA